jgi:cytochrome b
MPAVRVWDPLVRLCHWLIAVGVLLAWLSREGTGLLSDSHEAIGYGVLACLTLRLIWLIFSPSPFARLSGFSVAPAKVIPYLREFMRGQAPRHLGHNPLASCMALTLWLLLALISLSGWLYTTDRFWGLEWVGQTHLYSTYALLALLPVHLIGVVVSSIMHRENLVLAMLTGNKRHD